MLAIPVFAEQHHNAFRIANHGYGVFFKDFSSVTTETLKEQLATILENDTYHKTIQKASKILRSRPMDARQTAVHWVEHVLEFGGEHLRSSVIDMPLYQVWMLDIFAFCLLIFVLLIMFCVHVKNHAGEKFCGKKRKQKSS